MQKNKAIFVTGGTGFLGSYLLRYLVQQGYTNIRAMKRATSSMDLVKDVQDKIEWVEGDLLDVTWLEDVMQDMDLIYHCAAMVSFNAKDLDKMMQVNVEGTANMVNIALHVGVERFLHVSSIAALGRIKNNSQVDEETKWQRNKYNTNYSISKYLSEQEVWRSIYEGLPAIIINPSTILGSGFWSKGTGQLFNQVMQGLKFYPQGTTGFVDVRDVARLMIQMMESDILNERLLANGENLSYKSLFNEIAQALNKKAPSIEVNPFIRESAWRVSWLASKITRKQPVITKETARLSSNSFYYQNDKSKEIFGFNYTPIHQTIQETARQMLESLSKNQQFTFLPLN